MRWKDRIVYGPLFPPKIDAALDRAMTRVFGDPLEPVWWVHPTPAPLYAAVIAAVALALMFCG